MKPKFPPMFSAAVLAALIPAAAIANIAVGDTTGADLDEIRAKFEAEGYTVTEIEVEGGEIEVEYLDGGQAFEVTIAADTGTVLEFEAEDGDDEDHDDRDDDDENEDENEDDRDEDEDEDDDD